MPCDNINEIRFRDTRFQSLSLSSTLYLFRTLASVYDSVSVLHFDGMEVEAQFYKWIFILLHIYFVIMKLIVNLQFVVSFSCCYCVLGFQALDFKAYLMLFQLLFFSLLLSMFEYFALNQFQTSFILFHHTITHSLCECVCMYVFVSFRFLTSSSSSSFFYFISLSFCSLSRSYPFIHTLFLYLSLFLFVLSVSEKREPKMR